MMYVYENQIYVHAQAIGKNFFEILMIQPKKFKISYFLRLMQTFADIIVIARVVKTLSA